MKTTARWKSRKAGERALRYIFPATRVLSASRYNGAYGSQEVRMSEMTIRPVMKFIYLGYAAGLRHADAA